MGLVSHSLGVFSDGSVRELAGTLPADSVFVRVRHEAELPSSRQHVPPRMPEVQPLYENSHVPFGRSHQLLSKAMNPLLSAGQWTAVYHFQLWIANNQGFGMNGQGDNPLNPRANFIALTNIGAPLPKVEALTCGGNLLKVIGARVAKTTFGLEECWIVETLNYKDPVPTLEWINARPWLITTAVKLDGEGKPTRFPQGMQPNGFVPGVRHPLLADPSRFQVCIPKWAVVRWTEPNAPDPYRLYL